jgi:hypothetical protein
MVQDFYVGSTTFGKKEFLLSIDKNSKCDSFKSLLVSIVSKIGCIECTADFTYNLTNKRFHEFLSELQCMIYGL